MKLDELTEELKAVPNVKAGVVKLCTDLAEKFTEAATDEDETTELAEELKSQADRLAAAICETEDD